MDRLHPERVPAEAQREARPGANSSWRPDSRCDYVQHRRKDCEVLRAAILECLKPIGKSDIIPFALRLELPYRSYLCRICLGIAVPGGRPAIIAVLDSLE